MSIAGFQVFNEDGVLQIDHDYRNYGFKSKGSDTCDTALGGASSKYYAQVVVTGAVAPMVAICPTSGNPIGLYSISVSGSTWTYTYIGNNGDTFDYFVFDYDEEMVGTTKVGLEVYDESGDVVYSSGSGSMRIAGGGDGFTLVTGLDSSRDYAAIQTATGYSATYVEIIDITYYAKIYAVTKPSSTSMGLFNMTFEQYTVGAVGTDIVSPAPFLIVVDVTDL